MSVDPAHLDRWGHLESVVFDDGAVAGIIPRPGGWRIVVALDGKPDRGYDLVWWYDDLDACVAALRSWRYPGEATPAGAARDMELDPILT